MLSVLVAAIATWLLEALTSQKAPALVFFLSSVVISTSGGGFSAGLVATFLSALCCDFFFVPPLYTLIIPYKEIPTFILFVGVALLINGSSERLQAKTRAADQRFHDLVQGLDGIVWEADPKTLQFTFVNQHAEILLGYPIERWLTDLDFRRSILTVTDFEEIMHLYRTVLEGGESQACEYRVCAADGRFVWLRETVHVCRKNGMPVHLSGLCVDITERKQATEHLQLVSRKLVQVQEAERRQIARELHDEIGQVLTGLKLNLEFYSKLLPASNRPAPKADLEKVDLEKVDLEKVDLEKALTMINELMAHVRDLSLSLRPTMLDDLGLLSTMLWHFGRFTTMTRVKVLFEHTGVERRFPLEIEITAYRILQEALTNVARHAAVEFVTVRLWATAKLLGVQIIDNGCGFDTGNALDGYRTGGLVGMQERATLLGGHLTIESTPGRGTCLTLELPLFETDSEMAGSDLQKRICEDTAVGVQNAIVDAVGEEEQATWAR